MISYLWILRWALAMSYTWWILSQDFSAIDLSQNQLQLYIYTIYNGATLLTIYNKTKVWRWKNILTKKNVLWWLLYIVNFIAPASFKNAVLKKSILITSANRRKSSQNYYYTAIFLYFTKNFVKFHEILLLHSISKIFYWT